MSASMGVITRGVITRGVLTRERPWFETRFSFPFLRNAGDGKTHAWTRKHAVSHPRTAFVAAIKKNSWAYVFLAGGVKDN